MWSADLGVASPLHLTCGFTNLLAGAIILRGGAAASRDSLLPWWAAGTLTFGLGTTLFGWLGWQQGLVIPALGGLLGLLGVACFMLGSRAARGLPAQPAMLALPPVGFFLLAVPSYHLLSALPGVVTAFWTTVALALARAVWDLHALHRETGLRTARDLGLFFAGVIGWGVIRTTDALLGLGYTDVDVGGAVSTVLMTGTGFLGVSLAREGEAARAGAERLAAMEAGRQDISRLLGDLPALIFVRLLLPDGTQRAAYRDGDFETVTGWPAEAFGPDEMIDRAVHPEDRTLMERMALTARPGQRASYDWRMTQPDGSIRWMRTSAKLLPARPDGIHEIVGYVLNINNEKLAEYRADAANRAASLGDMAAGMAHQLHRPLSSIADAANQALARLQHGEQALATQQVSEIQHQALRAEELLSHLMRFARPASETSEPVCVGQAVQAVLMMAGRALRDARVAVEASVSDPPPRIMGDPVALQQVLFNLVDNARQQMAAQPPERPRRLTIEADTVPDTGLVRIVVADTGGGIDPEIAPRLLEPFVTTRPHEQAAGLGLAICNDLLRGMGGDITARNGQDGAIFTVLLPSAAPRGGR